MKSSSQIIIKHDSPQGKTSRSTWGLPFSLSSLLATLLLILPLPAIRLRGRCDGHALTIPHQSVSARIPNWLSTRQPIAQRIYPLSGIHSLVSKPLQKGCKMDPPDITLCSAVQDVVTLHIFHMKNEARKIGVTIYLLHHH